MVTRVTVTIFLVCDKVFPAVLDDDASGGSTDLATQQVITDSVCWTAGLGSRDGRMRVQILNGEAKTFHLQRSPNEGPYALGIVVAHVLAHIVFERAVTMGLVLWPQA